MARELPPFEIGHGFRPGVLGRVVELHGLYYSRAWNLGIEMESDMARGLAEIAQRYDPERDRILWAELEGRIVGSIAVDGIDAEGPGRGAKIRWFILEEGLHGRGIGWSLIDQALGFCRECGYRRVYLHTFEGLRAAITLYRRAGFQQIGVARAPIWGTEIDILELALDLVTAQAPSAETA